MFSNALHRLGMMGAPRRTMLGAAPYIQPEWKAVLPLVGMFIGFLFLVGKVLLIAALIWFGYQLFRKLTERPAES